MRTQFLKQPFIRWSLLVLLIALIGSGAFVLLVPRISLLDDQVTVEGRGLKEELQFSPRLEVTLTNKSAMPLMVEIPQALTLESDSKQIEAVTLKPESVFLWFWPKTVTLVAYTLESGQYFPTRELTYQIKPGQQITPELEPVLQNIQALNDEENFAAQLAVWSHVENISLEQMAQDLGLEDEGIDNFVKEYSEKVEEISRETPDKGLGLVDLALSVLIVFLVVALILGIFLWWRRRSHKPDSLDYLDEWEMLSDQGGMAEIWRAVDKRQQPPQKVVVKFPKKKLNPRREDCMVYRFWTEAEHHERLQHPNIVPVIKSGETKILAQTSKDPILCKSLLMDTRLTRY